MDVHRAKHPTYLIAHKQSLTFSKTNIPKPGKQNREFGKISMSIKAGSHDNTKRKEIATALVVLKKEMNVLETHWKPEVDMNWNGFTVN